MKERAVDLGAGLLLFICGAYMALVNYSYWRGIAHPERFAWWHWLPPLMAGCAAMLATIGLFFWKRASAIIGALSMVVISLSYLPWILDYIPVVVLSQPCCVLSSAS